MLDLDHSHILYLILRMNSVCTRMCLYACHLNHICSKLTITKDEKKNIDHRLFVLKKKNYSMRILPYILFAIAFIFVACVN